MTFRLGMDERPFKRAMIFSAVVHSVLLVLIIVNPSLPTSRKSGPLYYINFGGPSGGASGGGGGITAVKPAEETLAPTEVKPQTLRDLAALQKAQPETPGSTLRYPVDKPNREVKPKPAKKTEISKVDPSTKSAAAKPPAAKTGAAAGPPGAGAGLSIGGGKPGFGEGGGSGLGGLGGLADQIGQSDFPFNWYLQAVRDKISSNWFQSLVDPGVSGTFQVAVYFRIFKDGSISTVDIKESSGLKTLDQSAVRAIMRSAAFPPLPDGYDESYLGIILIFEHSK
jgi:TonB family protein